MADLADVHEPHLRERLEPGEELRGILVASRQKVFSGGAITIGVTDRRLLIQPLDMRGEPKGDVLALAPDDIASASAEGAGDSLLNIYDTFMSKAAVTLKLRTTGGEKLKLMLMRGGSGVLGRLGGGEAQEAGVKALGDWFAQAEQQ
jgi:hypothetical protein